MIRARTMRTWVVAAGFALATAITAVAPATASAAPHASTPSVAVNAPSSVASTYFYFTPVPASQRVACYGYYGTFKAGSSVMVVDWIHTSDECFGISTDRTIWHAWPNSGGWKKLGGGGSADDVAGVVNEQSDGTKGVVVWAASNNSYWAQEYHPVTGWTNSWYRIA
ncbi:hypothetical protein [Labedaea rhizosphaerae]|uniref:Peptidase inhibitor family I36 n=1 Tax=Labedaea rhizosphaerae TaxID=598644 RepID=A0A4R6SD29_LABRH|nr:hypothetical protein [Labedaea rhizosphaerae]TDP97604.1 hypothetical protein EV186_103568 [Labedaea rhizosphaerae]